MWNGWWTAHGMGEMIGQSAEMEKLYRFLSKVAFSTHPRLDPGESGTGKGNGGAVDPYESGSSAAQPFIPVDCGALTPSLIESELFGHAEGRVYRGGPGEGGSAGRGGTGNVIFLDEIGELPLDMPRRSC